VLPGNTFTDALGLKMTFAAYETSGPNITSWLRFNPTTLAFTGSVPATQSGSAVLQIVASDGHATAQELFGVTFAAASGHTTAGITAAGGSLYNLYIQPQVHATPLLHS
jgi:Putative Ig domain